MDRNELWAEAEELADLLLKCPEIEAYLEAEASLREDAAAQAKMARLRELQEEIGTFQARQVPEAYYAHLIQEAESLLDELEKIPIVQAFLEAQQAVNDLLQEVTDRLAAAVRQRMHPHPPVQGTHTDHPPPSI
ncbi:hypothetical protein GCM10010885_03150 [Alicyclobacillus cellulosilyticus]|uniref:Cell fate (Sporulation/competence/biofilm development) regulator YmcA (YheA/YmcA/DUF963 family) n=1 Tax=Alicyclobacillus cellulosilyticus TaxID=1003997 RepID=A0A917K151_9BACL|nr:YlbF family regulator [Alicyclobacillus cellulosilyticus]GGI96927.1 hypothetical protein GCM10010885_03150 [Alicyclobacillus cellulosilyticus]